MGVISRRNILNSITHFLIGIAIGSLFFNQTLFSIENIIIILIFSNLLDLDHLFMYKYRSKYHLRTFIQEPFAILIIGIPSALISGHFLGSNYFWAVLSIYSAHIIADYVCIFETWPLDPFNTKIVKREGYGIILPLSKVWQERKAEFPRKINEKYILIFLIFLISIILHVIFIL